MIRTLLAGSAVAIALGAIPVDAQPHGGGVRGTVQGADAHPIAGAVVALRDGTAEHAQRTQDSGAFELAGIPPGTYLIRVAARGYAPITDRTIDVRAGVTVTLKVTLAHSPTSLVTIGRVSARGSGVLTTSAAPSATLAAASANASGVSSVAEMIDRDAISATVIRPAGGGAAAPTVVALRGPDPTETLVDIDGHPVNSGGTGSFDLSLLDPADLESVELVYGIAPSSLVGPNTIDGAINIRTLEPTGESHVLERLTFGSFATNGATLQTTGSAGDLGYAFSLHRMATGGDVGSQTLPASLGVASVGSAMRGENGLAKLRYAFDRGRGYIEASVRDQTDERDLSAALTSLTAPGGAATPPPTGDQSAGRTTGLRTSDAAAQPRYDTFAGSTLGAMHDGYGLDASLPLGHLAGDGVVRSTLLARHLTAVDDQSVAGPAAGSSLYLYNDRDRSSDDSIELDRTFDRSTLTYKFDFRREHLDTQQLAGGALVPLAGLRQTQRSAVVRYTLDTTAQLHYSLAAYFSDYSSFGSSLDPRAGFVWTPTAATAVRASIGSTFQAPQLPELVVPAVLPPLDPQGFYEVGNPGLKADHATDIDLGVEHLFGRTNPTRVAVDLYRTNLRTPAQRYFPATTCTDGPASPPPNACLSYPINVGGAVYRGIEFRLDRTFASGISVHAAYSVNSSYATSVAPQFQSGTIVPGEQFQGAALQRGTFSIVRRVRHGLDVEAGITYEGEYNGLNRPAYATLRAGLTWHLRHGLDLGLYGTNLTDVYADGFTRAGAGVTYGGPQGPVPSDAYALPPRAFSLVLTHRT